MTTTTSTQQTTAELSSEDAPADTADDQSAGASEESGDHQEQAGLPLDHVFESLKNSRRRQVLRYLQETEGEASVGELAEHVAAIENDTTVRQLSSQQRKRVYVGLYQCHLPKLDDKNVLEYDDNRGTVELGPNAPQLSMYLDVAGDATGDETDRPWHRYYLGLAAAVAGLLVATLITGGVLGTASAAIGLLLTLGLVGLSLVHASETT